MKLGLSLFFVSACATTQPLDTHDPASRAKVRLDLSTAPEIARVFPRVVEPRLPSVDRIAHQVRARLGDDSIAAVDLCIAPDGRVTKVTLAAETTYAPFDTALVHDVKQWRFSPRPGATATPQLQTCERATIKYIAPR